MFEMLAYSKDNHTAIMASIFLIMDEFEASEMPEKKQELLKSLNTRGLLNDFIHELQVDWDIKLFFATYLSVKDRLDFINKHREHLMKETWPWGWMAKSFVDDKESDLAIQMVHTALSIKDSEEGRYFLAATCTALGRWKEEFEATFHLYERADDSQPDKAYPMILKYVPSAFLNFNNKTTVWSYSKPNNTLKDFLPRMQELTSTWLTLKNNW